MASNSVVLCAYRRKRSASLNLDEQHAFRWQAEASVSQAALTGTLPEISVQRHSNFADAGPPPQPRAGTVRQQIAAAEAIAKHGKKSRIPDSPFHQQDPELHPRKVCYCQVLSSRTCDTSPGILYQGWQSVCDQAVMSLIINREKQNCKRHTF